MLDMIALLLPLQLFMHCSTFQAPLTLYHGVEITVSTIMRDSTTIVHTLVIRTCCCGELVLALAICEEVCAWSFCAASLSEVWSGVHCQLFIYAPTCHGVTRAVLTCCLSKKLCKILFIMSHHEVTNWREWLRLQQMSWRVAATHKLHFWCPLWRHSNKDDVNDNIRNV